jgi:hypothetical protein
MVLGFVISNETPMAWIMVLTAIYGAGIGFVVSQLTNVILVEVPPRFAGVASGATNTSRQVGAALGITVLGLAVTLAVSAAGRAALGSEIVVSPQLQPELVRYFDRGVGGELPDGIEPGSALAAQIHEVIRRGLASGASAGAFTTAAFAFLGAICSLRIPPHRPSHAEASGRA